MPETAFFTARGEVLLMSKEAKATACEYTKRVTEAMFCEKNMARPRTLGDESLL